MNSTSGFSPATENSSSE
uniref:Uncharacterized protein n=1 Tax=Arundo donax TaxID=35708 RepID=A0A0A8ZQU3_ARUDO